MSFLLDWGSESVRACLVSEEPDLSSRFDQLFPSVWPEFNRHGDVLAPLWDRLYEDFAAFQFVLVQERTGKLLARGNTIPLVWDGTIESLPSGIDELAQHSFDGGEKGIQPNSLSAMAAEVPPEHRSKGLGRLVIQAMGRLAAGKRLANLLAPLRPTLKERYPLAPIEQYMQWKAPDGLPFDPWLRAHVLMGASILKPAPHSLRITGTVSEWESWTGMAFPDTGRYIIPNGLSPLSVNKEANVGRYWEPNIWVLHPVPESTSVEPAD